jgi:hypothetical protein
MSVQIEDQRALTTPRKLIWDAELLAKLGVEAEQRSRAGVREAVSHAHVQDS